MNIYSISLRRFLARRLGCAAMLSMAFLASAAIAQEMPSRARTVDNQIQQNETLRLRSANAPIHRVALSPTSEKIQAAAIAARGGKAGGKAAIEQSISSSVGISKEPPMAPYYVGPVFDSGMAATNLAWQAVPGGNVTHIVVSSDGAMGVRAKLVLPVGMTMGEIRVAASPTSVAEALPLSIAQDGVLWTPYSEGATQTIEIFTPQKVSGAKIQVERVLHFTESLLTGQKAKTPGEASAPVAGACTIDVACSTSDPSLNAAIADRSNSVAKINFVSGGGGFICSGTLLNSNVFPAPFFLTANHCISTQAEASSVTSVWFRKNSVCGANVPSENSSGTIFPGQVTLSGGAQLLFTNQMTDGTLLRLNQSPPAGVVYSGWNAAVMNKGDSVVSISHPAGAPMKLALGTVGIILANGQPDPDNTTGQLGLQGYNQQMYGVYFTQGIIEGGSSGSGIFTQSGSGLQLRGILSSSTLRNGTSLSCSNLNENSNYGRTEVFFPQIAPILNGTTFPAGDDFPNQPTPTGPLLPLNSTLNATLNYLGDLDVFRVVITEAGKLSVGSRGKDAAGANLDTMAILLRSDNSCVPLASNQDACNNSATNDDASSTDTNFLISNIDVQPGTYYVSVGMWDPEATTPNGYQIYSTFVPANAPVLAQQTITLANPDSRLLSGGAVIFNATASSGLPVTVTSLTTTVCSIAGSNIVLASAGVCTIVANQAGNINFAAAPQITRSFLVYINQPLSKRGAIDIDGNNKSVLLVRPDNGQMLGGRLVNNVFQFTPQADPGSSFRLVGATDFDGNGKSDLAFQNPTVLDVNGRSNVLAWNDFAQANQRTIRLVKPVWDVQAVGDLDGDGLGDLVWRYVAADPRDTGVSYIWFSNNAGEPVVRKRGGAPLDWKLLGAADLNGDGAADMIYISPVGAIRALMATAGRTCANLSVGTMPAGFTALKLADFTGQRRGDMLIRNLSNGQNALLSLNGVGLTLPPYTGLPDDPNASCTATPLVVDSTQIGLPTADPTWTFYASGDFNGDGVMDIVWVRPDRTLTVWLLGNRGVLQSSIDNAGIAPTGAVFQP